MVDNTRYGASAIAMHWITFALIVCGAVLGLYMVDLPLSPQKLKYFSWHKGIGVTVFLIAVARLIRRLIGGVPALPLALPAWQRRAAAATHLLLYVLIVTSPLAGWLYSSAAGMPTVYFGLVQLPDLLPKDKMLAEQLKLVHLTLNCALFAVVSVHVAAALKHHFVDRDEVMARMLPILRAGNR